jgi:hypothetical protein
MTIVLRQDLPSALETAHRRAGSARQGTSPKRSCKAWAGSYPVMKNERRPQCAQLLGQGAQFRAMRLDLLHHHDALMFFDASGTIPANR